jgi:uncharacterized protein (DUF1778 family)
MTGSLLNRSEIDSRIEAVRENLRELIEQAAADTGGAVEDFISSRIAGQEAQLNYLMQQRERLRGNKQ